MRSQSLPLLLFALLSILTPVQTLAQVTSADDGTGTRVRRNGASFDIDGGSRSGDGRNLFHSFAAFGLDANQVANFLASPETQNILGRVVGGNASVIDGLIRLSGGDANLYLINPAGIIFGSSARLDVPGSFTATTANGIGFGDSWFNAFGGNDYTALVGNPNAFAFTGSNPGSIINGGELGVTPGESLMLLGGTVINTGTLSAPGGQITVAAVPGEHVVRISQEDMLLSLELDTLDRESSLPNDLPFTPLDLPSLLAGGAAEHASGVVVEPDGTVRLTSTGTSIPTAPGTAIASGILDAAIASPFSALPEINVLGDRVGIFNATINANGGTGGGTVRIGGDFQGQGNVFTASRTLVDENSAIAADALEAGQGGRVIVWADEATGFYGEITARGGQESGSGGFVEVSGLDFLDFQGEVDASAPNGAMGTLLLDPTNIEIVATGGTATLADVDNFLDPDTGVGNTTTIDAALLDAALADVILQATNDITFSADVNIAQPQVGLTAEAGNNIAVNSNISTNGGNVTFTANADGVGAGAVSVNNATITTQGGDFTASGQGGSVLTDGVLIQNSAVSVADGNINLNGIAFSGGTFGDRGVEILNSSLITSGFGDINIRGLGGNNASGHPTTGNTANHGIHIRDDSVVQTEDGNISIIGTGGDGRSDWGVAINSSLIESTASGSIEINGTSSDNARYLGVGMGAVANSVIKTNSGDIQLVGSGTDTGVALGNASLFNESRVTTTNGNINITGNNTSSRGINRQPIFNKGIYIRNNVIIESLGQGNISLQSMGQNSGGIYMDSLENYRNNEINSLGTGETIISSRRDIIFNHIVSENSPISGKLTAQSELGNIFITGILGGNADLTLVAENGTVQLNDSIGVDALGNISPLLGLDIEAGDVNILSSANLGSEGLNIDATGGVEIADTLRVFDGGNVDIQARTSLNTGNIDTSGNLIGGDITLTGDRITTGNLTTTGEQFGGNVELLAEIAITTGNIITSSILGDAGNVFIDPRQDVEVGFIDARGGSKGGNVFIFTERLFRATETFGNNLSISTAGGIEGGSITIIHDGGARNIPFNIGNLGENGTAGTITSGEFTIAPVQSFPGSVTVGNIRILTTDFPTPEPLPLLDFEPTPSNPNPSDFDNSSHFSVISGPSVIDLGVAEFEERLTPPYENYIAEVFEGATTQTPSDSPHLGTEPGVPTASDTPARPNSSTSQQAISTANPSSPESPQGSAAPREDTPNSTTSTPDSPQSSASLRTPFAPNQSSNPALADTSNQSGSRKMTLSEAQRSLRRIEKQTGVKPALVYAMFVPESGELELLLVTASDEVIRRPVLGTQRDNVIEMARAFREELTLPFGFQNNRFDGLQAQYAQQFYQWLVEPLKTELEAREIDNIAFLLDEGLRSLPLSALHDGQQFIIEQYSVGLMPSLSLTDMTYVNINDADVLAMGASEFGEENNPLPATEVETSLIADTLWEGNAYMNEDFTLSNLQQQRRDTPFGIVHLATHASFSLDQPDDAYIQLWDTQLRLNQVRELNWNNPDVELVVLSACRTALGDRNTELGFAGFSTLAGVKSTLASLWSVDDVGTLGLMVEFYQQMQEAPIKAEALRRAQLAMLNGEVYIEDGAFTWSGGSIPLPAHLELPETADLSHPYYWSGFTLVGSPW